MAPKARRRRRRRRDFLHLFLDPFFVPISSQNLKGHIMIIPTIFYVIIILYLLTINNSSV